MNPSISLRLLLCATLVLPACVSDPTSSDNATEDGDATSSEVSDALVTPDTAFAPACIIRKVNNTNSSVVPSSVAVHNTCGKTMHIKIVLKHWPDSSCFAIRDGVDEIGATWFPPGSYDYTTTC